MLTLGKPLAQAKVVLQPTTPVHVSTQNSSLAHYAQLFAKIIDH